MCLKEKKKLNLSFASSVEMFKIDLTHSLLTKTPIGVTVTFRLIQSDRYGSDVQNVRVSSRETVHSHNKL